MVQILLIFIFLTILNTKQTPAIQFKIYMPYHYLPDIDDHKVAEEMINYASKGVKSIGSIIQHTQTHQKQQQPKLTSNIEQLNSNKHSVEDNSYKFSLLLLCVFGLVIMAYVFNNKKKEQDKKMLQNQDMQIDPLNDRNQENSSQSLQNQFQKEGV